MKPRQIHASRPYRVFRGKRIGRKPANGAGFLPLSLRPFRAQNAPEATSGATGRNRQPALSAGQEGTVQTVKVHPEEMFSAHVGGNGDAGTVTATIAVHRPSGRCVAEWRAEDEVLLGESVSDLEARGYSVTPWAR